jgi:hypothetical protein
LGEGRGRGRRDGNLLELDGNLLEFDVPKSIAYGSFMFPPSANVYVLQFSVKYSKGMMELLIRGSKQVKMIK